MRATLKKLVGTETAADTTSNGKFNRHAGGSRFDAYTELVAARTRKSASSANTAYYRTKAAAGADASADAAARASSSPSKKKTKDASRRVRVPGAARDASVSAPLAFNLRNAALVYSGVDIMVRGKRAKASGYSGKGGWEKIGGGWKMGGVL